MWSSQEFFLNPGSRLSAHSSPICPRNGAHLSHTDYGCGVLIGTENKANGTDASPLRAEVESSHREGLSTQLLRVEGCLCTVSFLFHPLGRDSGTADLGGTRLRLSLRYTWWAWDANRPWLHLQIKAVMGQEWVYQEHQCFQNSFRMIKDGWRWGFLSFLENSLCLLVPPSSLLPLYSSFLPLSSSSFYSLPFSLLLILDLWQWLFSPRHLILLFFLLKLKIP